jgi:hypothetical protein
MKIRSLQFKRNHNLSYDPRQEKDRKTLTYKNHFRNLVVTAPDLPINQMFAPANPYGYTNDHSYITDSETYFLTTSLVSWHYVFVSLSIDLLD